MGNIHFRSILSAFTVIIVLATSACMSPRPGAGSANTSPSATAAPSADSMADPTALPQVPNHVVVEAQQLVLSDVDGTTIESLPFSTDPIVARDQLTEWFGFAPTTSTLDPTHYCTEIPANPVDSWGDSLSIVHGGTF
ncbi:MAG: hypothetical protein H7288_22950 [Kineosporiaceae bacterium]|nr:hypothetical protein [Aeromicrobium sp.]